MKESKKEFVEEAKKMYVDENINVLNKILEDYDYIVTYDVDEAKKIANEYIDNNCIDEIEQFYDDYKDENITYDELLQKFKHYLEQETYKFMFSNSKDNYEKFIELLDLKRIEYEKKQILRRTTNE